MHQFSPDPFLTLVVGAEHDARLRRAADERRVRRHRHDHRLDHHDDHHDDHRHDHRHRRRAVRDS